VQRTPKALLAVITSEAADKGVAHFAALAQDLGVHLLIGSLAIRAEDSGEREDLQTGESRAVNRSLLFGPDGGVQARYDKIHLFDVTVSKTESWTESKVYDRGHQGVIADIGTAKIGLSICYDLRFPRLYRDYAQAGAHILCVPSAFTRPTGAAHWEILLRARAIETGSYVIAPAQGGQHADGRATWGRSMIIDPWGQICAHLDHDSPGFACADIELNTVSQARQKIPAWSHNPEYSL